MPIKTRIYAAPAVKGLTRSDNFTSDTSEQHLKNSDVSDTLVI